MIKDKKRREYEWEWAHLYIDGVFSGGGIKGIALIGAYETIEKRGFVFQRVAGTSAGSIIAAFIAAGYTSREIYTMMTNLNLKDFLDERKQLLQSPMTKWLLLYWRLGLYKGQKLEQWIAEQLLKKGVRVFADLPPQSLRVIVSDLSNGRLLVLPDDLADYGIDPLSFPVAKAIRASCSIPYFFEPFKLKSMKGEGNIIVDGGVLSNFPMWLFSKENEKMIRPVLGIKLSHQLDGSEQHRIRNAVQLFNALFETMRNAHDARYISKRHAKNIIFIQTKDTLATEFDLSEKKRQQLFITGKESAERFLKTWTY